MKGLITFGLNRPVMMNLLFIGLVIYGAFVAVPGIPIDRYPNFAFGEAQIITNWPGAPAEDVERLVTERIEDSLRGMKHIDFISSRSMAGLSEIQVKFEDDTDYDALYDDMRMRILSAQNRLPTVNGEALSPTMDKIQTDSWLPVVQVALRAEHPEHPVPNRQLVLAAKELRTELETLPGVKRIKLMGDDQEQFVVDLDGDKLIRQGVTLVDVQAALSASGHNLPAGLLDTAVGEQAIRVDGIYRTRNDILSVVVRSEGDGQSITVADLIDPTTTGERRIEGAMRLSSGGEPAVLVQVLKNESANASTVRDMVADRLDKWQHANSNLGIVGDINLDSTIKIANSLTVLNWSLGQGVILVALVLLVFLTWRTAVLTAKGIVVSFLGTIIVFYITGYSLNELTLLGFVLVVGIVVDDAIVVLENIQRHREEGKPLREAVVDGTNEVFMPVVSATLTTCASFLPLLLMTGTVGDFFSLIPKAVVAALVISLVECLLVLPLHVEEAERFLGRETVRVHSHGRTDGLDTEAYTSRPGIAGWFARVYDRRLRWNLRHPVMALGIVAALFIGSLAILAQSVMAPQLKMPALLKLEFFPDDTSMANVWVTMPSGTPLRETEATVQAISRDLLERGPDHVATALAFAGFSVDTSYKPQWSRQYGFLQVELPPIAERAFDDPRAFIALLNTELKQRFGVNGIEVKVDAQRDGPPTGQDVTVRVSGLDSDQVLRLADDVRDHIQARAGPDGDLAGIVNLRHDFDRFHSAVTFEPDRDELAALHLQERDVQAFLAGAFDGVYVGDYRRIDEDIPVRVRLARGDIQDSTDILDVPLIDRGDGTLLRFADMGTFATRIEPALLTRRDYARVINVTADFAPDAALNAFAVNAMIDEWYQEHRQKYPGASIAFGGEAEDTGKSYRSLLVAMGVSIFLIYLCLAVQFNSYLQPVIIMSNIIFSFTGVVLTLGAFGAMAIVFGDDVVRPERATFT
ncbi:MAG: efflux RND transporter permease subunit, partial [Planctomycetota bacterium]|nr:efflux RND transporter permease subunit [Planctomycetota bacterium]